MTPIAEGLLEPFCDKTPSTSEDISRLGCIFAQGNVKTYVRDALSLCTRRSFSLSFSLGKKRIH